MSDHAFVYLLRCRDGSLYCGWTWNLERRLAMHAAGRASRYTRSRLPVELALAKPMADRGAARREEARIKRLTRTQKLALVAARGAPANGRRAPAASMCWPWTCSVAAQATTTNTPMMPVSTAPLTMSTRSPRTAP